MRTREDCKIGKVDGRNPVFMIHDAREKAGELGKEQVMVPVLNTANIRDSCFQRKTAKTNWKIHINCDKMNK